MPITVDELAVPFRAQHAETAPRAFGQFGGAFVATDCTCGWEGTRHATKTRAHREWTSHRDAMRKLSKAQARWLRELRAVGHEVVPGRTAAALVARGLIERVAVPGHYEITPAGRGVLLEYDRVTGGDL